MSRCFLGMPWLVISAAAILMIGALPSPAQETLSTSARISSQPTTGLDLQPAMSGAYRKLAPGVLQRIPSLPRREAASSYHDVVEILAVDPEYAERAASVGLSPAKNTRFHHDFWALDFSFKSVRQIMVDVPDANGAMQRKLIWYLVYRVSNPNPEPVRFVGRFLLESTDAKKVYPDRVIPAAMEVIRLREDPNREFLNTVEITGTIEPRVSEEDGVWGVATWEDVDPTTDHFSVYVQGLTNDYLWEDAPGAYKPGDPVGTGRTLKVKTLVLKFWRPGDEFFEHDREIRFGAPLLPGHLGEVDYRWIYR